MFVCSSGVIYNVFVWYMYSTITTMKMKITFNTFKYTSKKVLITIIGQVGQRVVTLIEIVRHIEMNTTQTYKLQTALLS